MLKKITIYLVLFAVLTTLTGCGAFQRFNRRRSSEEYETTKSGTLETASLLRFSDIPIPAGFKIKPDESYSFQTDNFRAGLLKYTGSTNPEDVVQFFKEQMPRHNWQLVNLIEYEKRVMNFEKQGQSCLITIEGGVTRTAITLSISPKSEGLRETGTVGTAASSIETK